MKVLKLPRAPFLKHSQILLQHLATSASGHCRNVLEIGCGPRSPLAPMLKPLWGNIHLHQIDARPDVIARARAENPGGKVERLMASHMKTIPTETQDAVVAMSVFDQNADSVMKATAREIHRVLRPDGIVLYIHNEELNAPATSASALHSALQAEDGPLRSNYLLPSPEWAPENDLEYALGAASAVDETLRRAGSDARLLAEYVRNFHPPLNSLARSQSAGGQVDVDFVNSCNYSRMTEVRGIVQMLRSDFGLSFTTISTAALLARKVEELLFSAANGFEIMRSGVFEMRRSVPWQHVAEKRPHYPHIVRGITKFGYLANDAPAPFTSYAQQLNTMPARQENEILLVAYQYGLIAKKE